MGLYVSGFNLSLELPEILFYICALSIQSWKRVAIEKRQLQITFNSVFLIVSIAFGAETGSNIDS